MRGLLLLLLLVLAAPAEVAAIGSWHPKAMGSSSRAGRGKAATPAAESLACTEGAGGRNGDEGDARGSCPDGFFCSAGTCRCPVVRRLDRGNCVERHARGYTAWHSFNASKFKAVRMQHQPLLRERGKGGKPANIAWGSCAVVASSKSLNRKRQGEEIDKHDVVIRFNEAPTVGHEAHVGKKTTLRVQNSSWCGFAEKGEFCMGFQSGVTNSCKWFKGKSKSRDKACRVIEASRKLESVADNYLKALPVPKALLSKDKAASHYGKRIRQRASGGFFGVLLALNLCESVDIYGFTNSGGSDHYYRKTVAKGIRKPWSMKHHWTIEKAAFQELRRAKLPGVHVR